VYRICTNEIRSHICALYAWTPKNRPHITCARYTRRYNYKPPVHPTQTQYSQQLPTQSTSSYWQALPVHKYRATQTSSVLGWCFQSTDEHLPTSPRNTMPPLSRSRTKVLESSETSPTICQYKRFNNHVDLNPQDDHSDNPKSRKLTFNSQHYDVL